MRSDLLFIAPDFFNYSSIILEELRRSYEVTYFTLYPKTTLFKCASIFKLEKGEASLIDNHYTKITTVLEKSNKHFETILIIKGSPIPHEFYDWLKAKYPSARFIQYLWDDIRVDTNSVETFKYFDKILSFNPDDCMAYGLEFRPFFFKEDLVAPKPYMSRTYDLSIFWSYSNNRAEFLHRLVCANNLIDSHDNYFYLNGSRLLYLMNYRTARKVRDYYHSTPTPYAEMMKILNDSKCQIEIPHPLQKGLTTRPFETLASKTKIITTNREIINYDFYNPSNIMVISEESPVIDFAWLKEPYHEIPEDILKKYSLSTFIKTLLS